MEDYEVEHEFPDIGRRTMLLNARKVFYEGKSHTTLLLGIEGVTERRSRAAGGPVAQKDAAAREGHTARELQHRSHACK